MLPSDNLFSIILTHRLPLMRSTETVQNFLKNYYEQFISDLERMIVRNENCFLEQDVYDLVAENISTIKLLCSNILKVFDLYDGAKMEELYHHFDDMMSKTKMYISNIEVRTNGNESFKQYYRIRIGAEDFKERKDLFHIPMGKRSLINSYRYSIPGYPCLYLSTGVEMCWFECGMPKHFSYSAFKLNASDEQPINLINFSIAPVDFISTIVCCYNNCKTCNERTNLNNLILKYLVSFPLRAACSISVINRNVPFIEEYIFPQQLLLWLRDKSDFDGILYRTCSAIESAYNWNYINLVMPAKCIRGSYCENLTHMFELTPPVKVDVNKSLLKYSNKIDDVKKCLKMIESKYYNGYSLYSYRELIAISKNFIMLYDMLLSDNYQNAPTVYQTLHTLILSANMICKSKDSIKATAMAEAKDLFYNVNEDLISNEFDVIFQEFQTKVQPALNDFFHLAFIIYEDHMINYDEFESI